jgi:hypothetical protein
MALTFTLVDTWADGKRVHGAIRNATPNKATGSILARMSPPGSKDRPYYCKWKSSG